MATTKTSNIKTMINFLLNMETRIMRSGMLAPAPLIRLTA